MTLEEFIRDRSDRWKRLDRLLEMAEKLPERDVGPARIQDIVSLYRQACSDLNQARSFTADPRLISRLNQLTGRGYRYVYRGARRATTWQALKLFADRDVPYTFRTESTFILIAAGALLLGTVTGVVAVAVDPSNARDLIPRQVYVEDPGEVVQRMEEGEERVRSIDEAMAGGAFYYTHNIQVSFLAFGLGALTLIGGFWILFHNGVMLGGVMTQYILEGEQAYLAGWIGPHGALEIPAIIFASAAGLRAGWALFMPGDLSRTAALRKAFTAVWRIMVTSMLLLVIAGMIEGSFSQLSSNILPYFLKIFVGLTLFSLLMVYLFVRKPSGVPKNE